MRRTSASKVDQQIKVRIKRTSARKIVQQMEKNKGEDEKNISDDVTDNCEKRQS